MTGFVLFEKNERVVTLTLNGPEDRNALSTHTICAELAEAVERCNGDDGVSCVVVTGADPAFCAGGNVKTMRSLGGIGLAENPAATRANYKRGIQHIPLALWDCELPTIAAVNGPAIGAGCDLACMCDIRIASEKAVFAESFLKLGLVPGDGGAWLLPRIVGFSMAAEMTFTAEAVDANRAREIGLVSRVVPHAELLPAARALASRIAAHPPQALRLTKRLLRESHHGRLQDILELSAAFQALAHESKDHAEAVEAFLTKRSPTYTGK